MLRLNAYALVRLVSLRLLPVSLLLISLSVLLLLLVLPMTQQGMTMDGVVYAAISKNMAFGKGSIWDPHYSQTTWSHFYEHPSLVFFLQSLYFKVFGQHYLVERFYALTMALLQMGLLSYLWFKEARPAKHTLSFLLLLWVLVPLNVMAYTHNYIEGTALLFSLMSAVILIRLKTQSLLKEIFCLWVAAFFIFLGFQANGPVYTFPLVIPVLQTLILKKHGYSKAFTQTLLLMTFGLFSAVCFFWFFPGAKANIHEYLKTQLFASFQGRRIQPYTGIKHLYIVVHVLRAYWIATLVTLGLMGVVWRLKGRACVMGAINKPKTVFYLSLALCASLPVGFSPRQLFHYIMPSSPYYILFLMFLSYPAWCAWIDMFKQHWSVLKVTTIASFLFFVLSITVVATQFGGYERHRELLNDIQLLTQNLPEDEVLNASFEVLNSGMPAAYLSRASFISLMKGDRQRYYLNLKDERVPEGYEAVPLETVYLRLLKKKTE